MHVSVVALLEVGYEQSQNSVWGIFTEAQRVYVLVVALLEVGYELIPKLRLGYFARRSACMF